MIKKSLTIFLITLMALSVFSQNEVLNLGVKYKSIFYNTKESLAISNTKTDELVIFIEDYEKTNAYLFNKNFQLISEIQTDGLQSSFKDFEGYQINKDGTYVIFFKNKSGKKYGALHLDFKSTKASIEVLKLKLKKEKYLKGITFKDKFYLMSVSNDNSSQVHFYSFKDDFEILDKTTIPFSFANFFKDGIWEYAKDALSGPLDDIVTIDHKVVNPIDITSRPNKLYIKDDKIVLTLDKEREKTKVFTISLETHEKTYSEFMQPKIKEFVFYNSNSYFFENKIFQINTSFKEMKFVVKDFYSKELLKEIVLKKDDEITFKNSPIIQEGQIGLKKSVLFDITLSDNSNISARELEKTSQFLRKASQGDIGISTFKQKNDYRITLGSKRIITLRNNFSPIGGLGDVTKTPVGLINSNFNPSFYAYGHYSFTKSTYIDCLFNEEFEHIEGDITENTFDKIKAFEDAFGRKDKEKRKSDFEYNKFESIDFSSEPKLKNIFRHLGRIYFGYINTNDKNYHLVEFLD